MFISTSTFFFKNYKNLTKKNPNWYLKKKKLNLQIIK